jgi:outer membrane protein OmpA-like peptidoglycan-associated protein
MSLSSLSLKGLRMRSLILTAMILMLTACQSTPNPAQVTTLKNLGFAPGDDGWSMTLTTKPILFETGTVDLDESDKSALAKMARGLLAVGIDQVRVEGHTDNVGSAEYNRSLSSGRAEVVAAELAKYGMPIANIARKGYGFDKPIADNGTAQGRAQNRRVTIIVSSF